MKLGDLIFNKRMKRYLILLEKRQIALLVILLSTLLTISCSSGSAGAVKENGKTTGQSAPRAVRISEVKEMVMGRTMTVTGTLAAYDQVTVSLKVAGRLAAIAVDLGTPVKQNQEIAQVETKDYELRVQQATAALAQARALVGLNPQGTDEEVDIEQTGTVKEAHAILEEARVNLERMRMLVAKGIVARTILDSANTAFIRAESAYQKAREEIQNRQALIQQRRSELDLARQQLADTRVRAPMDGIVQVKQASVGEYLGVGAPVATIVRVNPLRLRVEVPERDVSSVHIGQQVRVSVEGNNNKYAGRIVRLSPTLIEQNRSLIIEAEIVNTGQLRPGGFAHAEIVMEDANKVLAVPSSAIVTFAGIEKVITVADGKAVEKQVSLGRRTAEWTEVLSGVGAGEAIVIEPGNLQQGQTVTQE